MRTESTELRIESYEKYLLVEVTSLLCTGLVTEGLPDKDRGLLQVCRETDQKQVCL
jgi:hypothetical protein